MIFQSSCKRKKDEIPNSKLQEPIVKTPEQPPLKITYHLKGDSIKKLANHFSPEQLKTIYTINRIDRSALRTLDSIIIPDTFLPDIMAYSPFPEQLPSLKPVNKMLVFSYRIQAFAAYENGSLKRWGPTSLGKKTTLTRNGLFHTNWRAKRTVSTVNDEWILNWYFNLENDSGVSLHQYELPGYPASHSCARLSEEDARWIYDWAESWELSPNRQSILAYGTPVLVFGSYNFDARLRKQILHGNEAVKIETPEVENELSGHLELILERQKVKQEFVEKRKATEDKRT